MSDVKRIIDHHHNASRWVEILPRGHQERVCCFHLARLVYTQPCADYPEARRLADRWVAPRKRKADLKVNQHERAA